MQQEDQSAELGSVTDVVRRLHREPGSATTDRVVAELCKLARREMRGQPADHTLQPTALVNEAYARLYRSPEVGSWRDRRHFYRTAALAMRQVLSDHARAKATAKRTPPGQRLAFEEVFESYRQRSGEVLALDAALDQLERLDPRMAEFVQLRFYAGRSVPEIAEMADVSPRTVKRELETARRYLQRELNG